MNFLDFLSSLKPYRWRLIFTALGFVAAASFLIFGFGKTMLVLICCGIGHFAGLLYDKNIKILERLKQFRNKW